MKLRRLLNLTRRALDQYGLTQDGDRTAMGVSGGKNSLTLLCTLHHLQGFYPRRCKLQAITVGLRLGNMNLELVKESRREFRIPYIVIPAEIGKVLFEIRRESSPCSPCTKMRKGAFNKETKGLGCNKITHVYHGDDVAGIMLMSLLYEGRFHSFSPYTCLDRVDLTVIRPLLFVTKADVIGLRNKYQLPVCRNPCPVDGYTRRQYVKELIQDLQQDNPHLKDCLFHTALDGNIKGWPQALK